MVYFWSNAVSTAVLLTADDGIMLANTTPDSTWSR